MAESIAPSRRLSPLALQRKVEYMATLIYNALGPGSKEKVYQKALEQMLHDEDIVCMSEKPVPMYFQGHCVAVGYADIVVQGRLVVELKALSGSIQHAHVSQCRQYMRALRISHGIVVNFVQHQQGAKDVEIFDCRLGAGFEAIPLTDEDQTDVVNGSLGPARPLEDVDDILSYVDHELPHLTPRAAGQKRLRTGDEPEGPDGPDVVAPGWVQIQQGKLTTRLY